MGVSSKYNFHSDCNLSSSNLAMVSHIAKPLPQHEADAVYCTYKPKKIHFVTFDPFHLLGHIYTYIYMYIYIYIYIYI